MKQTFILMSFLFAAGLAMAGTIDPGYKVGDQATDFKLRDVSGKMVSLADYPNAKGYIVIFTCNHCPFSIAYEDRIIDLHRKFSAKGYPVIAINPNDPAIQPDDSYAEMKIRAKDKGFPFPYLFDDGQKVFPQYGATRTPHVFLLDKNRVVRYIGAIDDNHSDPDAVSKRYVEDAIQALEEGRQPEVTFTRAVGCSIKTAN